MVGPRVVDHELSGTLDGPHVGYLVLVEEVGGDEELLVAHELGAGLEEVGEEALHEGFKLAAVLWGDTVPISGKGSKKVGRVIVV